MSGIRVFDLAKELGVNTRELADFIKEKMGLPVHHLTSLDELKVKRLRKIWSQESASEQSKKINEPLPLDFPTSEPEQKGDTDNGFYAKLQQVFKYLLELKNLAVPPKRDLKEYGDKIWWQADLPLSPYGCFLHGDGKLENKDAWLEIHKQQIPPYPEPPPILTEWIEIDGRDPSKPPSYKKFISGLSNEEQDELDELPEKIDELERKRQYLENLSPPDISAISQVKAVLKDRYGRWEELETKKEIKFEDSSDRIATWEAWRSKKWEIWAMEAFPKIRIQKLYGELFAAYQRFQKEGEDIEIVWGHGLLLWLVRRWYE